MFFDDAQHHPSEADTPESGIRFAMMLAELWHDWFEAMSEVAYQTHRACEFFVQHGGSPNGQHGRFDFREPFDFRSSRSPYEGPNGSIDIDKTQRVPTIVGFDPGGAGHARRSDDASHGGYAEKAKIARKPGGGDCLVGA